MAGLVTRLISEEHVEKWEEYVNAHPEATFFHRIGWINVIRNAFSHTRTTSFARNPVKQ